MKKIILITLLIFVAQLNAQTLIPQLGGQRSGISTAQFLKIGVGGRATGMGQAFVAVANDVSALYWNPAGLVESSSNELIFAHNEWVVDIKHEFFGGIYHLSENDAVGVAVTALHMDDMPVTTEYQPLGTGEYFSVGDLAFAATYSRKLTSQFSFGATIRYMESTMDKLKMRGLMVDLGTLYWTGLGTTRFAVTMSNFGNNVSPSGDVTLLDGSEKSNWQDFSLPTIFRFGIALEPYQDEMHRVTASAQLNHPNDNSENVSLGFEYAWKELFYLRGGYIFNAEPKDFSAGVGLKIPAGIGEVKFDYSYAELNDLGSAHRISIILGLY